MDEFDAEIFATGKHNGIEFTGDDLDLIVSNFAALNGRIKPPLKLGHNDDEGNKESRDGQPAMGWISGLKRAGDKLMATLSGVPATLKEAIKRGLYKRVSSEIYLDYAEGSQKYGPVLSAVALLGADIPAVKGLADLDTYLNLQSTETPGSFAGVLMCSEGSIISKENPRMDEITKLKADLAAANDKLIKLTEAAAISKAEAEALKAEKVAATKATAIARLRESVKAMKVTPAAIAVIEGAINTQAVHFSEDGKSAMISIDTVIEFAEKCGPIVPPPASGVAAPKSEHKPATDELHVRARKYAAEHKVKFNEAMVEVLKSDADLSERYLNEGRAER